jgi:hypothetical protein
VKPSRWGLWRVRLAQTRSGCLHLAEESLAAAERLQHIRRECQQEDARIYCRRAQDALLAVASIDQMTEPAPRRAYPETYAVTPKVLASWSKWRGRTESRSNMAAETVSLPTAPKANSVEGSGPKPELHD